MDSNIKDTIAGCAVNSNYESHDPTVGEHLDEAIATARKRLETLCITKAKAEAMQMLNYPMSFISRLQYPF